MKLTIGLLVANGFPVPAPFVLGWTDLLTGILTGAGNALLPNDLQIDACRVINSQAFPIDTARNEICRLFLDEDDGSHLLFLDCDMRHPADLPQRLLRHRVPVVTGRYQMRKAPFHTVAMRKVGAGPHDYKAIEEQSGLVPIDAAGAGCLLIERPVLETIRAIAGDDWFRYQVGPTGLRTVSEDMWFFEQTRACGYQPWCDLDAVCTHIASFEIDRGWNETFLQARDRQLAGGAAV